MSPLEFLRGSPPPKMTIFPLLVKILDAKEDLSIQVHPDDSYAFLYENGQLPSKVYEASPAPLVNVAFIFAQIWDIKGGLLYRAFHGAPRYAYKQLKADGVLPDFSDPGLVMTGAEALNLYTSCVIKYGNMQLTVE